MKSFKRFLENHLLYILLASLVFSAYPISYRMSSETIQITVKEKERITVGSGENMGSKFIVYSDSEVFENTDSWLYLKFSSSDYQNKLTVGNAYKVKVAGWRIPFLSMYRNIVEISKD